MGHPQDKMGHRQDKMGHRQDKMGHRQDKMGHRQDKMGLWMTQVVPTITKRLTQRLLPEKKTPSPYRGSPPRTRQHGGRRRQMFLRPPPSRDVADPIPY